MINKNKFFSAANRHIQVKKWPTDGRMFFTNAQAGSRRYGDHNLEDLWIPLNSMGIGSDLVIDKVQLTKDVAQHPSEIGRTHDYRWFFLPSYCVSHACWVDILQTRLDANQHATRHPGG